MSNPQPAPGRDERAYRSAPYDALSVWSKKTPDPSYWLDRGLARLSDIMRGFEGTPGLSDYERWVDQVKRELEAEIRATGVEIGDGSKLLREIESNLSRAYRFDADWHGPTLALFVMQSAVATALPRVFHVILTGPPGSGKTGLGLRVVTLCSGSLLGDASTAALARTTRNGRTIGIDEADTIRGGGSEAREAREALVRDAYRADAPAYIRFNTKAGKTEEFPTFGPRAIITREDLDTATAQRGVPIGCVTPLGDETYPLLVEGIWPQGVNDLARRVKAWGDVRVAALGSVELQEIASRPGFVARVKEVAGTTTACRETELAVVMLLVVEVAGLDYERLRPAISAALSAGLVSSVTGDEQPAGDAMAALRGLLPARSSQPTLYGGTSTRIRRKDWLDATNRIRRDRHDPNLPSKRFGSVLKDIGVKESWKVGTGGVVSIDLPPQAVEAARNGSSTLRTASDAGLPPPPELTNLSNSPNYGELGSGVQATMPNSRVSDGDSGASGVGGVEEEGGWDAHAPARIDRARARLEREEDS